MATLTGELKSAKSPVTQIIRAATPDLTGGKSAKAFRPLEPLVNRNPSKLPSQMGSTVGTAYDLLARMNLPRFNVNQTNAALGVSYLVKAAKDFDPRIAPYAAKASELYKYSINQGYATQSKARVALALGDLEVIFRAGPLALTYAPGERLRNMTTPESYYDNLYQPLVDELESLMNLHAESIFEKWKETVKITDRYFSNPTFGNAFVGADGDWIVGSTLVELKTSNNVNHSKLAAFTRQAVGYALLDRGNRYSIRSVSIWLPRYETTVEFELDDIILGGNYLLPVWRHRMQDAMKEVGAEERARYSV